MQSFTEVLVSIINHYHINRLHLFWESFEWFCLQISSDAKYFFLSCFDWGLMVLIVYYFQIWNKNNTLLFVELLAWVPCILRHPIYIYIVEPRLPNIIHSGIMFDNRFIRKQKQCCSGRLGQPFGLLRLSFARVPFSSAWLVSSNSENLFDHWGSFNSNSLFCLTWESSDNRGSIVYEKTLEWKPMEWEKKEVFENQSGMFHLWPCARGIEMNSFTKMDLTLRGRVGWWFILHRMNA